MEHQILHVFDLPQIYSKPSAVALLDALALLVSQPPSWDASDSEDSPIVIRRSKGNRVNGSTNRRTVDPAGVTRYLTSIVGNELGWIEDDSLKETIWEQASLRLAERSGRTAMPAIERTFRIPTGTGYISISIHEPALTADNLGLKTWASSYLLAKRLRHFPFPQKEDVAILELGSGTGLVGMAAAALLGASVLLTDLPEIVPNLKRNADANWEVIEADGGCTEVAVLDWTQPDILTPVSATMSSHPSDFPIILAADPLYSPEHPRLLVTTISKWLSADPDARVVVELPLREAYSPEIKDFRQRMRDAGLKVLDEGEETGYDDWGWDPSGSERQDEVTCWWSVFGWA
ncbi:hypothetical protein M501DRAFT_992200 [Patellaria atrata CBS 101060]|uniref:Glucose-inducible SAM-dependent methyltransferase Rrg1 n=1 Tax=Patellaria atrata CBS 101060 TaxID=1346257 RepID=A0A9P4SB20_9PEZI|nr:hypothetical protein M501DRAFT_992200 [Patellaria atrata CBS 101060]